MTGGGRDLARRLAGLAALLLGASLLPALSALPGCVADGGAGVCEDDRAEPDDDMDSATILEPGLIDRVACPGSPDFFIFPGRGSSNDYADYERSRVVFAAGLELDFELYQDDGSTREAGTLTEPETFVGHGCGRYTGSMMLAATSEPTPYMIQFSSSDDWCGDDE